MTIVKTEVVVKGAGVALPVSSPVGWLASRGKAEYLHNQPTCLQSYQPSIIPDARLPRQSPPGAMGIWLRLGLSGRGFPLQCVLP